MASRSRRCSSRCSPRIDSIVSSVMLLVTLTGAMPSWRNTELRCARSSSISSAARRLGGSAESRSVDLHAGLGRDRLQQRQLRLALAVLDEAQLAAGDADPLAELVEGEAVRDALVTDAMTERRELERRWGAFLDDSERIATLDAGTMRKTRPNRGKVEEEHGTHRRSRRSTPWHLPTSSRDPPIPAPPARRRHGRSASSRRCRARGWPRSSRGSTRSPRSPSPTASTGWTARAPRTTRCCARWSTRASSSSSTPSGVRARTSPARTRATSRAPRAAPSSPPSARRMPAPRTTGSRPMRSARRSPRSSRARCADARCTSCRSRWAPSAAPSRTSACRSPTAPTPSPRSAS